MIDHKMEIISTRAMERSYQRGCQFHSNSMDIQTGHSSLQERIFFFLNFFNQRENFSFKFDNPTYGGLSITLSRFGFEISSNKTHGFLNHQT